MQEKIEDLHDTIRNNIRKLRESKGLSQLELASAMGHSSAAFFAKAEHGCDHKRFNLEHLCKIAEILNVEIEAFFKKNE